MRVCTYMHALSMCQTVVPILYLATRLLPDFLSLAVTTPDVCVQYNDCHVLHTIVKLHNLHMHVDAYSYDNIAY